MKLIKEKKHPETEKKMATVQNTRGKKYVMLYQWNNHYVIHYGIACLSVNK
jgi:hypothetical protein